MRLRSGLEYTGKPTRIFCHCRLCSGRPNSEEFSPFKEDVVESVQQEIVQDEKKPNVEKKKLKTLRGTMFVWSLLSNMALILGALFLVIKMDFAVNPCGKAMADDAGAIRFICHFLLPRHDVSQRTGRGLTVSLDGRSGALPVETCQTC